MKLIKLPLLFFIFSTVEVQRVQAAEKEAVVIDVRKNVALSKNDKVYKNFYINAGAKRGLKKGAIVDVLRRLPLHDPLRNMSVGDLKVKVAELEIIFGDEYLSIARISKYENPEERPLLDVDAVMIGDRLDLASIKNPPAPVLPSENVALLAPKIEAKLSVQEGVQREVSRHPASVQKAGKVQRAKHAGPKRTSKTQKASLPKMKSEFIIKSVS